MWTQAGSHLCAIDGSCGFSRNRRHRFTDIVTKLVAIALGEHPALGGRWEGDRIVLPTAIHIGIAVDTEQGLLVPVIRDVAKLTLQELAHRSRKSDRCGPQA